MVTKWSGEKGRVLKVEERGGPRKMNKIRIASVVSSQDLRVCLFPVNRGRSFPFRFGGPDRGRPDIKVCRLGWRLAELDGNKFCSWDILVMDYGRCSIYSRGAVVYIDPGNDANSNENWGLGSVDRADWATEEDLGSVDADSNFDGMQSQTQSGSKLPNNKSRIPQPGDVQPTNRSKVIAKIFFKTQLCKRFQAGTCPNITNCNFAHSVEELRSPPLNWQELLGSYEEEQAATELREEFQIPSQSSFRGRHCKKFLTKEGCPDGGNCVFLHDEESRARESVAISLGPGSHDKYGGGASAGSDGLISTSTFKPVSWKTRICKWEQAGYCAYGDKCNFAHGTAELQWYRRGVRDLEGKDFSSPLDAKQGTVPSKSSGNTIVASASPVPFAESHQRGVPSQRVPKVQMEGHISPPKWKRSDKISLIYGDWFEDLP